MWGPLEPRVRHWKFTVFALLAGCVVFAAAVVQAQRVRIVGGRSSSGPATNGPGEAQPENKVQPVDPTPEQAEKISKLIEQLGAPTLRERDRAMSELAEFGACAIKQVKEAQGHDDDEIGHRCTVLLEVLYSGKAELFLAARRLGMTDKELEQKLSAPDPTPLLLTLEQNAGAGMAPIWARVLTSLSDKPSRFPAALACRKCEGAEGYGGALARAAREIETRQSGSRTSGLVSLVSLLPPQGAEQAIMVLAALSAAESPVARLQQVDEVIRAARALRGIYEAHACLAVLTEENLRALATPGGVKAERLLFAVALALAPAVSQSQLKALKLPSLMELSVIELQEYAALCARSGLAAELLGAIELFSKSAGQERAVTIFAQALGQCHGAALAAFDNLPLAAQLGVLDAWWFVPPAAAAVQPFLLKMLESPQPALRAACAELAGGYRALSTARALAQCALKFEDTLPIALGALAPMADLLAEAAPEALKALTARLEGASMEQSGPLIDVLAASGDAAARLALRARFAKSLAFNELGRAMRMFWGETQSALGAYCGVMRYVALMSGQDESVLERQGFGHGDWVMMRALLARDDAGGFALLETLAANPYIDEGGKALVALALAGKDAKLAPSWSKLLGSTDPRQFAIIAALAVSQTPEGEEFRARARKQALDSPERMALFAAVAMGRGGKVTRDMLLEDLADKPDEYLSRAPVARVVLAGPLPARLVNALATNALLERDTSFPAMRPDDALIMLMNKADVLKLLYGAQADPVPRTPLQISATAALAPTAEAAAIVERLEAAKDGANFELRECARALTGKLSPALARAVLRSPTAGLFEFFVRMRRAQEHEREAALALLDGCTTLGTWHEGETIACFNGSSRYGVEEAGFYGSARAILEQPAPQNGSLLAVMLARHLLGETTGEDGALWWRSRRGLLEFDAAEKRLKIVQLK